MLINKIFLAHRTVKFLAGPVFLFDAPDISFLKIC